MDCKCLIVLIGKRILLPEGYNYSYTHNWVGFEVGVAACYNKPIIVFEEDSMNFNDTVQFPVPYLNHYVRYNRNESNSKYIMRLLKDNIPVQKNMVPVKTIKCPYPHCRVEYIYWNIRKMNREESMYLPSMSADI